MTTETSNQPTKLMEELKAKNALVLARLGIVPYFSAPWIATFEDALSLTIIPALQPIGNQPLNK